MALKIINSILLIGIASCTTMENKNMKFSTIEAPVAKIITKSFNENGVPRKDDYYWLKERENKEVIQYLNDENKFTDAYFSKHKKMQDEIFEELKNRVVKNEKSFPFFSNGYFYYQEVKGENEYSLHYRSDSNNNYKLLVDFNALSKGKSFCDEGALVVSPDNTLLAYSVDFIGRRKYEIYIKNLSKNELTDVVIPNTTGTIVWSKNSKHIFYTVEDEVTLRSYKVMCHELGTDTKNDKIIYEESDETFSVDVSKSKSGNFIIIESLSTTTAEALIIPADNPYKIPEIFEKRERGHEYSIDEAEGIFYIRTNKNAPNFKLCKLESNKRGISNWKNILNYNETELTEGFELFKNYLVVEIRSQGLLKLKIINFSTGENYFLNQPEEDYVCGINVNEEYNSNVLRYHFSSLKTPTTLYDYDMNTKSLVLLKQQKLNVKYNINEYETKRINATSRDGKNIPISLVYKKDKFENGKNPLLIYGYGSYGSIVDPFFSPTLLTLLDRGFVYAIAHIRGGQDLGRAWYEDGKLLNKKNTFFDFIDCTKYLIDEKFADRNKVFAQGGSAGGLLMGAVSNFAPDLYKGIIADVPFVDVVTTMLDKSIPLTTGEYDEWGNPTDKKYYDYMLSYSPYDNVKEVAYPALLVTTGLHDSQVQYWEPAKWVAKLRKLNKGSAPLLLYTNMNAGHGGASGRFSLLKEVAMEYTFILTNL